MDYYNKLTIKELLQLFLDRGIPMPTFKEGLVALLENHDRYTRNQKQLEELAAIEQKIIEGKSDITTLLNRTMKNLLSGFNFQLPKLPTGVDVIMKVLMQVTHVRVEALDAKDQEQDQERRSQSPDDEAQENAGVAMQGEQDDEEGDDDIMAQSQPSKEKSGKDSSNAGSLKRKAPASGDEPQENFNPDQEVATFARKARSAWSKKPWKKQKRNGGRFAAAAAAAAADTSLADN